jgi:glycosyltransferase involved in cell wall biosynthesis
MRVAIVHDDLMRRGGAEQVVLSMLKAFPEADLYTMCYQPELTYPEFKQYPVKTSLFNYLIKTEKAMKKWFFPIGLICMKWMYVENYDVVIISNTYCAKYVSIDKKSKVFIYTYTPFRLAWNPSSYQEYLLSTGLKRFLFNRIISLLQMIDSGAAKKGTYFLSMTRETVERVKDANYFLIVSRLEFYKSVDLAIAAFNDLQEELIIVGNGSKKSELMAMANGNIKFMSGLSKEQLADLYAKCRAFIFPQHEDYGITPLEANASGRPVVAFGKGGVLETMVPYDGVSAKFTAIFFKEQKKENLIEAVNLFKTLEIDSHFIREHAKKFDESVFEQLLKKYVEDRMKVN